MKNLSKVEWENPRVFEINKEKARTITIGYDHLQEAISLDESPWKVSLNGVWKFKWAPYPEAREKGFYEKGYAVDRWTDMEVPVLVELKGYGTPYYFAFAYPPAISTKKDEIPSIDKKDNPVSSFKRTFTVDPSWLDRETFVYFGGVKSAFYLWINGNFVGYSQGSMLPAEFNISKFIHAGENDIAVEVYRYSDGTYLEDQDMWFLSGIFREVSLYTEPKQYIRDFHFKSKLDENYEDAEFTIDMDLVNRTKRKMILNVELFLFERGHLEEPVLTLSDGITIHGEANRQVSLHTKLLNPRKWSCEHPNLYDIFMVLKDENGDTIQVKHHHYGFRSVEIVDAQLLINGKSLLVKGVNRHDFDPDYGWNVPKERYHEDLKIIKQHNINSIRASHYPNNLYFYRLCDEYGIYVMDEADLETHGVRKHGIPGDRIEWRDAVVDRMVRMIERDKNHPCIIIWSLGNEAGFGKNFAEMKKEAMKIDTSRPFHYEGDADLSVSDFLSKMYPTPAWGDVIGNKQDITITWYQNLMNKLSADQKAFKSEVYKDKPVILCEYAHAMENSLGNFQEHMDRFEKYDNYIGGYIWDFVDQTLRIEEDGVTKWLYGGDFGEKKSSHYFCANGIVFADRSLHPSIKEVKKVYQNVGFSKVSENGLQFEITNKFMFTDLNAFSVRWTLLKNGECLKSDTFKDLAQAPLTSTVLDLSFLASWMTEEAEYILTLTVVTTEDERWSEAGHELAWEQFILKTCELQNRMTGTAAMFSDDKGFIVVGGSDFEIRINKKTGWIENINYGGMDILKSPLTLNFWRPETDNDRGVSNFEPQFRSILTDFSWKKAGLAFKLKKLDVTHETGLLKIDVHMRTRNIKGDIKIQYIIDGEGTIKVTNTLTPKKDMIRLGMQVDVDKRLDNVMWYGKGPHENYFDRKRGAKVGIHNAKAGEMMHYYMRPQENGNRTEIRWFELTDENGGGIRVGDHSGAFINFSLWQCTMEDIDQAEHIHEMVVREHNTLNIDYKQRGVGGDDPGTLQLMDQYKLHKEKQYQYSFIIERK